MNIISNIGNIHVSNGVDLTVKSPIENVVDLYEEEITPESIEREKRIQTVNMNILNKNYSIIKELTYLPLESLIDPPEDWVIFKRMNEVEKQELKTSIMNYGLFTPLIVWERLNGQYMILSGVERSDVLIDIYNENEDNEEMIKKFGNVPCFVLGQIEINDVMARIIRIDSNVCQRNMDTVSKNKAIITKYKALQYFKEVGRTLNILDELSESFNMSRTGITNHLAALKVIEEFLYLFQEGKLSLKSIKKLSKFSLEDQKNLYEGLGELTIKECQISALSEEGVENHKRLEQSIKILKDMKVPFFSSIKLNLPTKYLKEAYELLEKFIKRNSGLYIKMRKRKIS